MNKQTNAKIDLNPLVQPLIDAAIRPLENRIKDLESRMDRFRAIEAKRIPGNSEFVRLSEIAEVLGMSMQNIRYHARKGHIEAKKVGNLWFVDRMEAESFVQMNLDKRKRLEAKKNRKT